MHTTTILIVLSSILTVASVIPYIIGVIRGVTKPRVVSWLIWGILIAIISAAAFAEGQYATAFLALCASVGTLSVAVLGWKRGNRKINILDKYCLIGAAVGIYFWWLFNSPAVAVLIMIAIDFVGVIPTFMHSWKKPNEEVWITYMLSFIGVVCTLLALNDFRITAFAYPLYSLFTNLILALVIMVRRRVGKRGLVIESK